MSIDWRLGVKIGTVLLLCCALTAGVVSAQAPQATTGQASNPSPLVLAFYYTWFDQSTWTPAKVSDMPVQPYVSSDRAAMARQMDEAKGAGIDAFVVSWYGPGGDSNQTEPNFIALLDVGQQRGFKFAVDFETASPFLKGQNDIVAALKHVLAVHGPKDAYLKWNGRPVIFFWAIQRVPTAAVQSALDAWRAIRQQVDPDRQSVWIAEGVDIRYQEVFDGHHLYSIAWSKNVQGTLADWGSRMQKWSQANGARRLWVATVMPGYNDLRTGRQDAFVAERRDGALYQAAWQGAMASQADWVVITSFNEWVEGSQIEPSQSYGTRYLDLTREWAAKFKAGEASKASAANEVVSAALVAPVMPVATATLAATATITPTATMTPTVMPATATTLPTPTDTATAVPTEAPTLVATAARLAALLGESMERSPVAVPTETVAPTATDVPTPSPTASATSTVPATATDTPTLPASDTPTPKAGKPYIPPAVVAGLATAAAQKVALRPTDRPTLMSPTAESGRDLTQMSQPTLRPRVESSPLVQNSAAKPLSGSVGVSSPGLMQIGGPSRTPAVIGTALIVAGALLFALALLLAALFLLGSRGRRM